MNKLNDIFKMISQMEKNAEEVKLGKHEVELSLVDDLKNSISKGSFEIGSWTNVVGTTKQEFTSIGHPNPVDFQPLLNKNWNNILAVAKGFWQRGNYLIIEFDGAGKFRIIRGSKDTTTWHNCI